MGLNDGAIELDSHANMIVIGKYCLLINDSGTTIHVNVNSFLKKVGSISEVPIKNGVYIRLSANGPGISPHHEEWAEHPNE